MPNKKINQLDARIGATLADLLLIGDPVSGTSYKFTATELATLLNAVPYTGANANVNLGEYGISGGYFQSDLTPTMTGGVGRLIWNDTDGTLDLGLKGGNVTLQIGQEQVQRVVNKSGINLTEAGYQVVKVTSAQGQRLAVDLAQANNDANSADTLGIVTENINNNQEGFITTSGIVRGIDTTGTLQGETWVDGDVLYLSPITPGAITKVKPTAPQHSVILGYVVYAHQNNGKIFVKCDNGYEIGELHDCYLPSPSNNDGIFWNTANSRYQNNTIAGVLGYTPVTSARTLTINGTAYDLSADRSWTVGATPAGSNTQIQYNNAGAFGASAGLTYNDSTGLMKILKNQNANTFFIVENTNNSSSSASVVESRSSGGSIFLGKFSSTTTAYKFIASGDGYISSGGTGDLVLQSDFAGSKIKFGAGGSSTAQMTLTAAGRLLLGLTAESTYLLDVNGTARFNGVVTLSGGTGGTNSSIYGSSGNGVVIYAGTGSSTDFLLTTRSGSSAISLSNSTGLSMLAALIDNVKVGGSLAETSLTRNPTIGLTLSGYNSGSSFSVALVNSGIAGLFVDQSARIKIGTYTDTFNSSAILDIVSTTKGFLPPRMTTTQKNAISSPASGLQVYDTTLNQMSYYNGTTWVNF